MGKIYDFSDQLYEWFSPSALFVRPSDHLPACHTFFTIFPSSIAMTEVMPMQKVKVKGHRNRGQNAIANLDPNERFRTGRGALLFFKDICQICRSHGTKISSILTRIERFYKSPR